MEREELGGPQQKQSFVDLGCGNGLLVYLLASEGVSGRGGWEGRGGWVRGGEERVGKERGGEEKGREEKGREERGGDGSRGEARGECGTCSLPLSTLGRGLTCRRERSGSGLNQLPFWRCVGGGGGREVEVEGC